MSYYREIRLDELVAWLQSRDYTNNGLVEVDITVLADDLFNRFDILSSSDTAT
jgi:hypothetical protein